MEDDSIARYDPIAIIQDDAASAEAELQAAKKSTFRSVRGDLIDAASCLKAIGEAELGNELWEIIDKMLHHETFGPLAKATASEGTV